MLPSITVRNVPADVRDELAARWLDGVRARKASTGTHLDREQILAHRDTDRR